MITKADKKTIKEEIKMAIEQLSKAKELLKNLETLEQAQRWNMCQQIEHTLKLANSHSHQGIINTLNIRYDDRRNSQ